MGSRSGWFKNSIFLVFLAIFLPSANAASLMMNGGSTTLDGTQNYDYVTLTNGAILYVTSWSGAGTTGQLTLNVAEDVTVDSTSQIIGDARGYYGGGGGGPQGGGGGGSSNGGGGDGGSGGWGPCPDWGVGGGGGGGGGYASTGGGGGCGGSSFGCGAGGGGGGGGGASIGTSNGPDIRIGSGGGGGGGGGCRNFGGNGGGAGQGGAMLTINAKHIKISGTVSFNGGGGGSGGNGGTDGVSYWGGGGGGGGGGSGGGIKLNAIGIINITGATIRANGGGGGSKSCTYKCGSNGGTGSGGRIKFFYGTLYNTSATVQAGSVYYEKISCGPPNSGDWIIPNTVDCICGEVWNVPADIYVYGNLTMQNGCNIKFTSSNKYLYVYPKANIFVYSGAGFNK